MTQAAISERSGSTAALMCAATPLAALLAEAYLQLSQDLLNVSEHGRLLLVGVALAVAHRQLGVDELAVDGDFER